MMSTRFLPALGLALLITVTSPFMGLIRDALFDRFPVAGVRWLAIVLTAVGAVIAIVAVLSIRQRRVLRWTGLGLTAVLIVVQAVAGRTDFATVDVAEKIHIFEYGLMAILIYRGLLRSPDQQSAVGDLRLAVLPVLWVTIAGAGEELAQWYFQLRVGEIRDVGLDAFAGLCGVVFAFSVWPPSTFRWRIARQARRKIWLAGALTAAVLGLFVDLVHLGHRIHDPKIGAFYSVYSADELRQVSEQRQRLWAIDPPTGLVAWKREDRFLGEAAWHANHRNERYRAGDWYMAAQANRILESWYSPFLDIESFRGSGRHRYPEALRRELLAKALPARPDDYVSPVLESRIWHRPSATVWRLSTLGAVVLLLLSALWPIRSVRAR